MKRYGAGGAFCAALLIACTAAVGATAPPAAAQAPRVDARVEVAAALYAASATQAAAERLADEQLGEARERLAQARARIEQLRARDASARAELAAAQEAYVAELAARDRAYAQEIAVFRQAVEDIAQTPEGAAALARFNAGDEAGAIGVLDRLVDARERARRVRADIETAAERRRVARLALEASARRRVERESVIARFEEVVRLDPSVHEDWMQLHWLYSDRRWEEPGRLQDAIRASERAAATARDDDQRTIALFQWGNMLGHARDYAGGRARHEECLAIRRRLAAADPSKYQRVRDLLSSLRAVGRMLSEQRDFAGARRNYEEGVAIARRSLETGSPRLPSFEFIQGIELVAHTYAEEGDFGSARARLEEGLAIARRYADADPSDGELQKQVAWMLDSLADLSRRAGDPVGERAFVEQGAAILRRVVAETASHWHASELNIELDRLGRVLTEQGDLAGARAVYEEKLPLVRRHEGGANVAATLKDIADLLMREGDFAGAHARYQEAVRLRRRLHEQIKSGADTGIGDSVLDASLVGLSRAALALGDVAGARSHAQESVDFRRSGRGEMDRIRLAQNLTVLGAALTAQGDLAAARAASEESVAIWRSMVARQSPSGLSSSFRYSLAVQLGPMCEVLIRQGDLAAARAHCEEASDILSALSLQMRDHADFRTYWQPMIQEHAAHTQFTLGEIALLERRSADARRHLQASLTELQRLSASAPADVERRLDVLGAEFRLAQAEDDAVALGRAVEKWRSLERRLRRSTQSRSGAELEQLSRTRNAAAP